MYGKKRQSSGSYRYRWQKIGRIMKLCFILIFVFSFGLSATTRAQQERVSLKLQHVSLREVLEQIREQTQLQFMMSREQGERLGRLTVDVKDETVEKVLEEIFSNTSLTYTFMEDIIVVKERMQQQQQTDKIVISGVVKDSKKQPIPGVTVIIKGTTLGAVTDADGAYTFTIPQTENVVLVFSFVGMKTKEVAYKGEKEMNVILEDDVQEMDEVVVTGIFKKARESYTGSVTTISSKEIKMFRGQNMLQTLRNIDPSFNIVQNNEWGSDPNRLPEVNIRGNSSLPVFLERIERGGTGAVECPFNHHGRF